MVNGCGRPRTVLPSMAASIVSNLKHVQKHCPGFLNKDAIKDIGHSMQPFLELLERLNTNNEALQARPKDIKAMLHTSYDGEMDAMFEQFLVAV